jgi:Flp pilus assembly protein TadG
VRNRLTTKLDDHEGVSAKSVPIRRGFRRRAGAAAVELALLLPLLVFLFVVGTDFARVFYLSLTLTNCARAGALYASDPSVQDESPYSNVEQAALADAANLTPQPQVTSNYGFDASGVGFVIVTVSRDFTTISSFPGVPKQLNISRSVRMSTAPTRPNSN